MLVVMSPGTALALGDMGDHFACSAFTCSTDVSSSAGYADADLRRSVMVVLGIVLLVIGLLVPLGVAGVSGGTFVTIGIILIIIGLVLNLAPGPWSGGATGTRRRYY